MSLARHDAVPKAFSKGADQAFACCQSFSYRKLISKNRAPARIEHLPNLKVQVQILPGSPTFSKA
jgi:hypothetical protein